MGGHSKKWKPKRTVSESMRRVVTKFKESPNKHLRYISSAHKFAMEEVDLSRVEREKIPKLRKLLRRYGEEYAAIEMHISQRPEILLPNETKLNMIILDILNFLPQRQATKIIIDYRSAFRHYFNLYMQWRG